MKKVISRIILIIANAFCSVLLRFIVSYKTDVHFSTFFEDPQFTDKIV